MVDAVINKGKTVSGYIHMCIHWELFRQLVKEANLLKHDQCSSLKLCYK